MATPDIISTPNADEPALHLVEIVLCTPCLSGEGGTCWTPGCALWCNTSPDVALWDNPAISKIERC